MGHRGRCNAFQCHATILPPFLHPPKSPLSNRLFQWTASRVDLLDFASNNTHTLQTMFGAFRPSSVSLGGLLWKSPYRLSPTRKANLRKRLRRVDDVIAAVAESGVELKSLNKALALPKENEMKPRGGYLCQWELQIQWSRMGDEPRRDASVWSIVRCSPSCRHLDNFDVFCTSATMLTSTDKYTTFDPKASVRNYRKSVHFVPKWTKVSDTVETGDWELLTRERRPSAVLPRAQQLPFFLSWYCETELTYTVDITREPQGFLDQHMYHQYLSPH